MRRVLLKFIAIYVAFVAIGAIQKPLFLIFNGNLSETSLNLSDWFDVIAHGFAMDCAVAAYLTSVAALILFWQLWRPGDKKAKTVFNIYIAIASLIVAATATVNLGLYPHWRFPLDATPIFYFTSSPAAALASATIPEILAGVAMLLALAALTFILLRKVVNLDCSIKPDTSRAKTIATLLLVLLTGSLFIAMRGGFTVSTMNISRSYYSQNQLLNHAAVNPAFSLLYSATHQQNFKEQFHFFESAEVERGFAESLAPVANDSTTVRLLSTSRPDICLIILESFSAHLLESMGGERIAVKLDSIGDDGVIFTNIFASSFRTDRALPAILGGFPGQPTTSVMKFADKTEHLPSLPKTLKENGWNTAYYYGGDINFTNMLAYLVNCGFEKVVCDKDFPLSQRTGKWGAHDHLVFERALADISSQQPGGAPQLNVIQTSSSHEPFEVPFNSGQPDKPRNAFAYADNALGNFIDSLSTTPRYANTLVVIVPDHYGAYPKGLSDTKSRHHIPVVLTGGALAKRHLRIDTVGAQTDLAATLLAQVDIDPKAFTFSKNIFGARTPKYAFFSDPTTATIVDHNATATDLEIDKHNEAAEPASPSTLKIKYFLQKLYETLDSL